jgi:hypothetical protein
VVGRIDGEETSNEGQRTCLILVEEVMEFKMCRL